MPSHTKYLAQVLHNDLKVQEANRPAVLRSAAEIKRQNRRDSFALQQNIMRLATGGRVIPSLDNDNDDVRTPSEGLKYYSGSTSTTQDKQSDKVRKSYELMRLFYK